MRTHELLYTKIGNIFAEIWSAWEKADFYEEIANSSQRNFILFLNNNFWGLLKFMLKNIEKSNTYYIESK